MLPSRAVHIYIMLSTGKKWTQQIYIYDFSSFWRRSMFLYSLHCQISKPRWKTPYPSIPSGLTSPNLILFSSFFLEKFSDLQSTAVHGIGPVYLMVGDNRLSCAPCTHPSFMCIVYVSKRLNQLFLACVSDRKLFAFIAFILALESKIITAVVQWIRAFAPQAEGWVFESQPRHTCT